jgi:hypothetical protein
MGELRIIQGIQYGGILSSFCRDHVCKPRGQMSCPNLSRIQQCGPPFASIICHGLCLMRMVNDNLHYPSKLICVRDAARIGLLNSTMAFVMRLPNIESRGAHGAIPRTRMTWRKIRKIFPRKRDVTTLPRLRPPIPHFSYGQTSGIVKYIPNRFHGLTADGVNQQFTGGNRVAHLQTFTA